MNDYPVRIVGVVRSMNHALKSAYLGNDIMLTFTISYSDCQTHESRPQI